MNEEIRDETQEKSQSWIDDTLSSDRTHGISYFNNNGYIDSWTKYERYYEGDQWNAPTKLTQNLPRPVFNMVKYIVNHKVSSVINDNIKMVFTSQEVPEDDNNIDDKLAVAIEGADKFTQYSATAWEDIQQDSLNEEMLQSGAKIGTGILHYYWDDNVSGGITSLYKGDLKGEFIDPINCFFGNPQQRDVQKQPYILITQRELLTNVRALAKRNKVPGEYMELLKADKDTNNDYDSAQREMAGVSKTLVLTKYYKKNGAVHFKKTCGSVVIQQETNTGLRLYPVVVFSWENRKKSIYGLGEIGELLTTQQSINFILAMMILTQQNMGFPKLLVRQGALKQQVTNTPGEILTDYSGSQGDGIKYMQATSGSGMNLNLVDKFFEYTRTLTGATDTSTGQLSNNNMSASAIMLLQKASGVPIESIKKRFYKAMEDVGRVYEEFWKTKYNIQRKVVVKDSDGNEAMMPLQGTMYKDYDYKLKIDIGSAGIFSESLSQSVLDNLFNKGDIDLQLYLKYSPKSTMPFKDSLLKDIEKRQQEQELDMAQKILSMLPPEQSSLILQQIQAEAPPSDGGQAQPMNTMQNGTTSMRPSVNKVASGQI